MSRIGKKAGSAAQGRHRLGRRPDRQGEGPQGRAQASSWSPEVDAAVGDDGITVTPRKEMERARADVGHVSARW